MVIRDYLFFRAGSLRADRLRHTAFNSSPGAAAARGLGSGLAMAQQGFAACFPCAEPSDCKTRQGGDVQCPGVGREQLHFPLAAGELRSPAQLPTSISSISWEVEHHPPQGSSPQLPNCRLLAAVQGVGCSTWGSRTLPKIHPCSVTQVVESLLSLEGKLPSSPSGAAGALLASQSEHLSESLQLQKWFQLKIALGTKA